MQYSVRRRRRLRPTGDYTAAAAAVVQPVTKAEGSGAVKRPERPLEIIEKISPRAFLTSSRR